MKKLFYFKNPFPKGFTEKDLSDSRKKRYEILASEENKEKFLASEQLTTELISLFYETLKPVIEGDAGIKPFIKNSTVNFSRTYAHNDLIIATDNQGIVGVDAEKIKPYNESVIKYFFTKDESEYVAKSKDRDFAFTLIWTRKESYMKCTGEGLNFQFNKLNVTPESSFTSNKKLFRENQQICNYFINSYYSGNTIISLCSSFNEEFPELETRG